MTSKSAWSDFPDIGAAITDPSLTLSNRIRAICNKFVMSGSIACADIVKNGKLDDPDTLMKQYRMVMSTEQTRLPFTPGATVTTTEGRQASEDSKADSDSDARAELLVGEPVLQKNYDEMLCMLQAEHGELCTLSRMLATHLVATVESHGHEGLIHRMSRLMEEHAV